MKRLFGFILIGILSVQGVSAAWAMERGTPEYEKMKEYKRQQREKRLAMKTDPEAARSEEPSFWQKEAARSGLAGTAAMFGGVITNAVPFSKPGSAKTESAEVDGPVQGS